MPQREDVMKTRHPYTRLTLIVCDDSPFVYMEEPCQYRTITLELTEEQRRQIAMRKTGTLGSAEMFEYVSRSILEGPVRCVTKEDCDGED